MAAAGSPAGVPPGAEGAAEPDGSAGARPKGGRVVKARYLQYDRKPVEKSTSANSSVVSGVKRSEKGETPTGRKSLFQKCKATTSTAPSTLNRTILGKDDLQSTLLEGHKIARPDLDLSAINDKSLLKKIPGSKSLFRAESRTRKKEQNSIEKNITQLEEKGERNLSILCEEKEKQQKKLYELKRQLLLKKREQKLEEVLDKQIEVLAPLLTVCEQFKEEYKTFATALDTTRHELPMKNIHIEGNRHTYLEDLQKHLAVTQSLLVEAAPGYLEENSKAFPVLKELKEVALKMDAELERSFKQVQDLSFEVSKEVSLHNQKVCEETHGIETLKHWYFD
ncbi:HAUS augmin-like complex subunit 8 isoform X2 [Trachemys scripta elegans]|uniref:HAUS augmin-like complex subunit 8 isoform X2 n=1 Tax=Trachemys scripta elegans TaxID=31138 RepID=UPI001553B000|nr:HAUS augmin-like complex subunit 8 isoform X2 [Trachemys scripta elegans]